MMLHGRLDRELDIVDSSLNFYLDNWGNMQGNENFYINSNEKSYLLQRSIKRMRAINIALILSEDEREQIALAKSVERICTVLEKNFLNDLGNY